MAAGLGFKTFTTGEVLTAADTNGYLMQGINVFASTAARDAAITSPQEGQFAYTKDTNSLWYYTGSAWAASGATGDIEGVTAGVGITGGGTSGTVTITNDMATTITASGDIVVGTGSGTYDNLPIGTTGQILTADTTVSPYKVKWATPAGGGGKVLQVIQATSTTNIASSTTTLIDSGLSATITPSSATSKVLVMTSQQYYKTNGNASNAIKSALLRGATQIAFISQNMLVTDTAIYNIGTLAYHYLDSPSTTSATTYKIQFANTNASNTAGVSSNSTELQTMILMEIGA
jgi:hypothetical protein